MDLIMVVDTAFALAKTTLLQVVRMALNERPPFFAAKESLAFAHSAWCAGASLNLPKGSLSAVSGRSIVSKRQVRQ